MYISVILYAQAKIKRSGDFVSTKIAATTPKERVIDREEGQ